MEANNRKPLLVSSLDFLKENAKIENDGSHLPFFNRGEKFPAKSAKFWSTKRYSYWKTPSINL